MGLYKHFVFICSNNCLFLSICLYIFGDLLKVILPVSFCVALQDIYYMHLVWEDVKNDLNRITDFFEIYFLNFLNFINVLAMFLDNLPWRQLIHFIP